MPQEHNNDSVPSVLEALDASVGEPPYSGRPADTIQPNHHPWWKGGFGFFTRRRNKAVVRRVLEAFNTCDTDVIDELEHPGFVDHIPFPPGRSGVEGIKLQMRELHEAFDKVHFEETSCIAEGDLVVLRHRMSGIHRAPFLGVPPTNRWISWPGQDINRVRNGKIVEHLGAVDVLEFLDGLGVLDGELLEHPKLRKLRAYIAANLVAPTGGVEHAARPGRRDHASEPAGEQQPRRAA
jgi:predicted ester cyclase